MKVPIIFTCFEIVEISIIFSLSLQGIVTVTFEFKLYDIKFKMLYIKETKMSS